MNDFDPSTLRYNDAGLLPVIAQDERTLEVLMLAWMNKEAIERTLETGKVTYWSRSRSEFWIKGKTSGNIQDLVESESLFYPLDPASLDRCTIGGTVAENAGGARALKYGVTRDYIIGLKGVWANGETFALGGKQIKNVAGYDLIRLLVGSEGTLAVITEITLKLIPKPKVVKEALVGFLNPIDAVNALVNVRQSGIQPSTAEYMTDFCVDAAIQYLDVKKQFDSANAYIIWQVDGYDERSVNSQLKMIENVCQDYQSKFWYSMNTIDDSNHIWAIRRSISLGLKKIGGEKKSEDVVVPPASVPDFLKALESMAFESGIKVLGYGHLGDGNIHVNILKMNASDKDWGANKENVVKAVMELAISYHGTISGEHGIGLTKKQYMPLVFKYSDLEIMRQIKKSIDPNLILNPGKIFD